MSARSTPPKQIMTSISRYNFAEAEARWQAVWAETRLLHGARGRDPAEVLRS